MGYSSSKYCPRNLDAFIDPVSAGALGLIGVVVLTDNHENYSNRGGHRHNKAVHSYYKRLYGGLEGAVYNH